MSLWLRGVLFAGLVSACGTPAPAAPAPKAAPAVDPHVFRYAIPEPGPAPLVEHPAITRAELPNGLAFRAIERASNTVSLRVVCRAGSTQDPIGKSGLAAVTARMLTEGTRHKTAIEQAMAVESLGASLAHGAGRDTLSLGLEVLPEHVEPALGHLAEALTEPGFREADLRRVIQEWLDDLRAQHQDPERLMWLLSLRALLGSELGRDTSGSSREVESLTRSDLRVFHAALIQPKHCALLAAGSIEGAAVFQHAVAKLGTWKAAEAGLSRAESAATKALATRVIAAPPALEASRVLFLERPSAVQSNVAMVRPLPARSAGNVAGNVEEAPGVQGYDARRVVNNLFGGLFTSRLNQNLREQNAYTYGAFSATLATRHWGALLIASSVRADVTLPALQEITAELARLKQEPPREEEVQRARTDLIRRQEARLEHTALLLDTLEEDFSYDLGSDYFEHYRQRLLGLELGLFQETAKGFPDSAFWIIVVADPSVGASLGSLGLPVEHASRDWVE